MTVFNVLAEWGQSFSSTTSFFSDFFWNLSRGVGDVINSMFDFFNMFIEQFPLLGVIRDWLTNFFNQWSMLDYLLGFGLAFFIISHFIKLFRDAYFF